MVHARRQPYREFVDKTPDYMPRTRPRSTIRVLGGLLVVFVVGGFLLFQCVWLYAGSTPPPTLEVPRAELQVDVPKLFPLPSLGSDGTQTHGVWVTLREDGSALALLSRDPRTRCFASFRPSMTLDGLTGVYREGCHGSTYDRNGQRVFGPSPRDLDRYRVETTERIVIVHLEDLLVAPTSTPPGDSDATPTRVR
jgi:hypothetical protein